MSGDHQPRTSFRLARILIGIVAVIFGLGLVGLAALVGHCSAFGGTCPSAPPPLFEDDVFGTALLGGLCAAAVPLWLARPGWKGLGRALAIGLPVAFVIGLIVRDAAAG